MHTHTYILGHLPSPTVYHSILSLVTHILSHSHIYITPQYHLELNPKAANIYYALILYSEVRLRHPPSILFWCHLLSCLCACQELYASATIFFHYLIVLLFYYSAFSCIPQKQVMSTLTGVEYGVIPSTFSWLFFSLGPAFQLFLPSFVIINENANELCVKVLFCVLCRTY